MYRFITDPGHGWLEVPAEELSRLGIEQKISSFSFVNRGKVYLEEDCDFAVFRRAKLALGETVDYAETYQKHTPIRNYQRYEAAHV